MSLKEIRDVDLIQRCIQGEEGACRELFARHRHMVASLCFKFLGPTGTDLPEMIQTVFVELFKSLPRFQGQAELSTWIYRISANLCFKEIRKRKTFRRFFVQDNDAMERVADQTLFVNPEKQAQASEIRERVDRALECLHPKKKMVLVLHDMEHKTIEEIADILSASTGTIKARLFYARREMAGLLRELRNA